MTASRGRNIAFWLLVVVTATWILLSRTGKPPDVARTLVVSPKFGVKRVPIRSASNRKGLRHLPRSVSLKTSGKPFRAALLDLSTVPDPQLKVEAFLKASAEIENGVVPTGEAVMRSVRGVDQDFVRLHRWPWGGGADYMLIVAADEDTEVHVRVSYGGPEQGYGISVP